MVKTWVFLTGKCNHVRRDEWEIGLAYRNTDYEEVIDHDFNVVCFGLNSFSTLDKYIVPFLRLLYPSDIFIFVHPKEMHKKFTTYLTFKLASQTNMAFKSMGYADIARGVGFSLADPAAIKHEMAHLQNCGTWHDEKGQGDIMVIRRHPTAARYPWCRKNKK